MNQLLAAFFKLPLDVLTLSVEGFLQGVHGFQDVYNQQFDPVAKPHYPVAPSEPFAASTFATPAAGPWPAPASPTWHGQRVARPKRKGRCGCRCEDCSQAAPLLNPGQGYEPNPPHGYQAAYQNSFQHQQPIHSNFQGHEENSMSDTKCEGVQLISYKISFVKESLEAVLLRDGEDIVSDASDCGTSFEVWKTAQFMQELQQRPRPIPSAWKKDGVIVYPPEENRCRCPDSKDCEEKLPDFGGEKDKKAKFYAKHMTCYNGLPENDKKFLRFYQDVLASYERETTNYQEQQAEALKEIARKLP